MTPRDPQAYDRLIIGLTIAVFAIAVCAVVAGVYRVVLFMAGW